MTQKIATYSLWVIVSLYPLLAYAGYHVHHEAHRQGYALTFVVGLFGVMSGWVAGFLISPANKTEETAFTKYASAAYAFLSGYVLSKIEPVITKVAGSDSWVYDPINSLRLIVFCYCFLSGVLIMYMTRVYPRATEPSQDEQPPARQENEPVPDPNAPAVAA